MSEQESWQSELTLLCHAAIDDQLTEEQSSRLEKIVLGDRAARQTYVEYLHEHACLAWSFGDPHGLSQPPSADDLCPCGARRISEKRPVRARPGRPPRGWRRMLLYAAAAAATLVISVWVGQIATREPQAPVLGSLVDAKNCTWNGASLPTEIGTRLTPGRLRLAEGVARLRLAVGAEIALEGPADLELVSRRRCVLRAGRLVAKISDPKADFVIETRTAVLRHQGTEFGVNVEESGLSEVEVFDGAVDVQNKSSGKVQQVRSGKILRVDCDEAIEYTAGGESPSGRSSANPPADASLRVVQISTATGRGRDATVQSSDVQEPRPRPLLGIKNTLPADAKFQRKAYLGFDLSSLRKQTIVDGRLDMMLTHTSAGYVSMFPDATFAVYGMVDKKLSNWNEAGLNWANAPANLPGGAALDPSKVMLLGKFVVRQGVQFGTCSVTSPELARFLNSQGNGIATLIVVRETVGQTDDSLIHNFASRYHPDLPPPTLKLTVKAKAT